MVANHCETPVHPMNDPLIFRLMFFSVVLLVGFGVFALVKLLEREGNAYGQALSWMMSWMIWSVAGLLMLIMLGGLSGFISPLLAFVFGPLSLMLLVLLGHAAWLNRRRRGFTVLSALDQATRQNLPIPGMLRAMAKGESRSMRTKLNRLAGWIEDGGSVGEGLEQLVPELAATHRATVAAGERAGRLPETLRQLRREDLDAMRGDGTGGAATWMGVAYGVTVSAAVVTMLAFVTLIIFPKYIEIFNDFGTRLPWVTRKTFEWTGVVGVDTGQDFLFSIGGFTLVLGVAMIALTVGAALRALGSDGGSMQRGAASVLRGWAGAVPGLGVTLRRGAWSRSYGALASGLRAGYPLAEAASAAGLAAVDRRVERAWRRLAGATRDGATLAAATRTARLPRGDRPVLSGTDTSRGGGLMEAARFLETRHDAARQRAAAVMRSLVLPAVVVALAVVVGWVCYAMFAPLPVLIEATLPTGGVR